MLNRFYRGLKNLKKIEIDKQDYTVPNNIMLALSDDLNTPKALAEMNLLINKINSSNHNEAKSIKGKILAAGKLIGILQEDPEKWLGYGQTDNLDSKSIELLIKNRNEARREKNFVLADNIRDELKSMGIEIEDTENGTIWRNKK